MKLKNVKRFHMMIVNQLISYVHKSKKSIWVIFQKIRKSSLVKSYPFIQIFSLIPIPFHLSLKRSMKRSMKRNRKRSMKRGMKIRNSFKNLHLYTGFHESNLLFIPSSQVYMIISIILLLDILDLYSNYISPSCFILPYICGYCSYLISWSSWTEFTMY